MLNTVVNILDHFVWEQGGPGRELLWRQLEASKDDTPKPTLDPAGFQRGIDNTSLVGEAILCTQVGERCNSRTSCVLRRLQLAVWVSVDSGLSNDELVI